MNTIERDELVSALQEIKYQLCCYKASMGGGCDCKFGVTEDKRIGLGEAGNGCPEVALASLVIKAIPKKQYAKIIKKIEGTKRKHEKKRTGTN